jgi:hypothetical protein
MKKNKAYLSARQGFAPIAIVLIVVAVLAIGGVAYYAGKSFKKENNFTSQPAGNDIAQPVIKENTNVVDPNNPDMMIYTSDKLGIQFTYPKTITIDGGPNNKTKSNSIFVSEENNKLTVSAGGFGTAYALIFHKNSSETFEQSILRQLVKPEYQNNPCTVKKITTNGGDIYKITFPGDIGHVWDLEKEGADNSKKCLTYPYLIFGRYFYVDPIFGGFYMIDMGGQAPVFGDYTPWWPKGIKFIK